MPTDDAELQRTKETLQSSRALAKVLDDWVTIPGTNIGIGLDVVLGLVPGIGDAAGTALSGAILVQAVREGVSLPVIGRMIVNVVVDALLGLVPVIGDAVDVAHRANRKNVRLLDAAIADPGRERRRSLGYLIAAGSLVVVAIVALIALLGVTLWGLWTLLTTPLT